MPQQQEPSAAWGFIVLIAIFAGLALVKRSRRGRSATPLGGLLSPLAAVVLLGALVLAVQGMWGQVALAVGLAAFVWFRWFYLPRRWRFHVKTLGELLALTPRQFEAAVGEILRKNGHRDVRHVGGAGDLTADLLCRDEKGRSVVVQCKRHSPGIRVGSPDIQELIGMMTVHHRTDRGMVITTADFTQPAIDLARRHGIILIDGKELTRLIGKGQRNKQTQVAAGGDPSGS